ncbi:MAG: LacI family DNA-binding transcriptional regulator [Abditibacteriaceae bacterium]
MTKVTIYDVANEAQMSPSTISRILRGGQGHVYPETTRERVHEIAHRLGYRANAAARLLSQGASTMIGMSIRFTEHPYLNRFLVAIHQELLKHNYDPVFLDADHLSNENSAQPFPPPHMLAGLISLGLDLQHGWPKHYAELRHHIPIVALQPVSATAAKWVDVVQVNYNDAYLQVYKHLTSLGHRHIAYLGPSGHMIPSDRCKNKGWKAAVRKYGLSENHIPWSVQKSINPIKSNLPEDHDDFLYQSESHQSMEEVVRRLNAFPERITALICASDEVAIGLQSYLQSIGKKLPNELSVVGYDGISMGGYVYPSLTTIAPDYTCMAEAAVERLIALIESNSQNIKTGRQQSIAPHLIVRGSTAPPLSLN